MSITILPVFGINSFLIFTNHHRYLEIKSAALKLGCWIRERDTLEVSGTLQQCIELSEKFKEDLGCLSDCPGSGIPRTESGCSAEAGWNCSLKQNN
jgi:hypothetical protein